MSTFSNTSWPLAICRFFTFFNLYSVPLPISQSDCSVCYGVAWICTCMCVCVCVHMHHTRTCMERWWLQSLECQQFQRLGLRSSHCSITTGVQGTVPCGPVTERRSRVWAFKEQQWLQGWDTGSSGTCGSDILSSSDFRAALELACREQAHEEWPLLWAHGMDTSVVAVTPVPMYGHS